MGGDRGDHPGFAFLVGIYGQRFSLEAAWKYVLICSVGVAFALYGTVLVYANAFHVLHQAGSAVLWTEIARNAGALDPMIMKLAFVFILIGFGTKAGLFPMHTWLPDAHSEASSPVSSMLSGVLLNCALFAIIRYYIIISQPVGTTFPRTLLLIFGALSVAVAAFSIFAQPRPEKVVCLQQHRAHRADRRRPGARVGRWGCWRRCCR